MSEIKSKFKRIVYACIWVFAIYMFYIHYLRNEILKDSLAKIEQSLISKTTTNTDLEYSPKHETITGFLNIDYKSEFDAISIKDYTDIFENNIEDICAKIKNIYSVNNNKRYKEYATTASLIINNYYKSVPVNLDYYVQGNYKQRIKKINSTVNDIYCASCYYASIKDNKTSLLLAYLPILIINEIDVCNNPHIKLLQMDLRNNACMNLLFIINNISIDKELGMKISKSLLEIAKSECSMKRYVDYTKARINYEFSKNKKGKTADFFIDNVCSSEFWKNTIDYIYDNALEEIKKIESGTSSEPFVEWQNNVKQFFTKTINSTNKESFFKDNFEELFTLLVISIYPETFFLNFKDLYQKRLEYLSITEGTAIAIALAAYSSDKNEDIDDIKESMPENVIELGKWLGVEIPIDRVSKSAYEFYFTDDYFLAGSSANNKRSGYFDRYLPYLRNRWVVHPKPTINGKVINLVYKYEPQSESSKRIMDSLSRLSTAKRIMKRFENDTLNQFKTRLNF